MYVENDPRTGQTVSSRIMTTLRVTRRFYYGTLCQIKISRCVLAHLIHRIWHRATSGSSPKVKMTVKGKSFESIQDVEPARTAQLQTLTKDDFQNCFRKWQERWDKCARSVGACFKVGINVNVSLIVGTRMGAERGVYRVLVGKPEGKRPLGRPRCRWVDNNRIDL